MVTSRTRNYRTLGKDVSQQLKEEIRLIWDAIYDLRDNAKPDVRIYGLTRDAQIEFDTFKGKPVIIILIQDAAGGHTPRFSSKFKGINTIIWDTTPNTYTTIHAYPVANDKVLCVAGVTGALL